MANLMVQTGARIEAPRRKVGRKRLVGASAAVVGALLLSSCWSANQDKDLGFINQYRRANSRAALNGDSALMSRAQAWAQHMANTGVLEHSGGGGTVSTRGIANWCGVAENVGYGSSTIAVHQAFLRSSGHRANIIGNYDRVGTGVVRVGGTVWVAEVYVRSC